MSDDLALAPISHGLSDEVFWWDSVLYPGEGEVYARRGRAGNYEDLTVLGAPWDQVVHCLRIRLRHENIRRSAVDDGSLAREADPISVDAGIARCDLPILSIGNFGVW